MTYEVEPRAIGGPAEPTLPRIFLREAGWQIAAKVGSEKTYCYQMAPGEDHYHRLYDGELLVHRGDERLCIPCAERRGLITFAPRPLRDQVGGLEISAGDPSDSYDLKG